MINSIESLRRFAVALRLLVLLTVVMTITGCSGGGGDELGIATEGGAGPRVETGDTSDSGILVGTSMKTIVFSKSAPQIVIDNVSELISPVGSGKPGSSVAVPDRAAAPSASILALNNRGQILMATTVSDSNELSADSTAFALVTWMLGPEPLNATVNQISPKVRAAASFGALVDAVNAAQQKALPVTTDPNVLSKVITVVGEVVNSITLTQSAGVSGRVQSLAVKDPSIPYSGFAAIDGNFGPVPLRLAVKDVNGTSAIRIVNTTPLYWAVRTEKQDGTPMNVLSGDSSVVDGYGILKGASVGTSVLANVPWVNLFVSVPEIDLQDLPTEGFNLRIAQSKESVGKNWEVIVYQFIKYMMKLPVFSNASAEDKCYLSIANFAIQTTADQGGPLEPNVANLKSILSRAFSNSTAMFKSCAPEIFGPTEKVKQLFSRYASIFFPEVAAMYEAFEKVGETNNVLTLVAQVAAFKKYYSYSEAFGICERKGPLGNGTITACLTSLNIKPFVDPVTGQENMSPSFLVGSRVPFGLEGKIDGKPALLPASLKLFNAFPGVVSVDLDTFQLAALTAGSVALDIKDGATDKRDALVARVINRANLISDKASILVGEVAKLRLVDAFGKTVFSSGSTIAWDVSPSDIVNLSFGENGFVKTVTAVKASLEPITIRARSGSEVLGSVSINVLPQPDFLVQIRDRKEVSPDIACSRIQISPGGKFILGEVDQCYTHIVPQIICTGPGCAYVRVFPFLYVFTEASDSFGGPVNPLSPECINPIVTVLANGQPEQPEYSATASGWFAPPTNWGKFARTWENMFIYKRFSLLASPQEYGYCHPTGLNLKYGVAAYSLLTKEYKIIRGEISR